MDTVLKTECQECGKAYQPKITRFGNQTFTHDSPVCDCEKKKIAAAEHLKGYRRLTNLANLPEKYADEDMSDWMKVSETVCLTEAVKSYLQNLEENVSTGKSMLFVGPNGTGKTKLLSWMALKIMWRILQRVFFIDADQLSIRLSSMRDGSRGMSEFSEMLVGVPVLILDDFGGSDVALWKQKYVSHALYQRYYNGKATFFSSNCHYRDLEEVHGKAVMSRIIEMCGEDFVIELPGNAPDMRIPENRRKYERMCAGNGKLQQSG